MVSADGDSGQLESLLPISLDDFEGPMDVLLHLIRNQKMNIFDIPMATLTGQYMQLISSQQELDLDLAGEYILMASTLMQIKSRMLLPRPELDEEGEPIDPREALVLQLMACEQYRQLGEQLNERPRVGRDLFSRCCFPEADTVERPLPTADLHDVLLAFRQVLQRTQPDARHHIQFENISMQMQMQRVLDQLEGGGELLLADLFRLYPTIDARISSVLAVLELWRQRIIDVWEATESAGILLVLKLPAVEPDVS